MKSKNILWTLLGIVGTIISGVSACALFEEKRTEMNRQVNAAVDKRFMQLLNAPEEKQTNNQQ